MLIENTTQGRLVRTAILVAGTALIAGCQGTAVRHEGGPQAGSQQRIVPLDYASDDGSR